MYNCDFNAAFVNSVIIIFYSINSAYLLSLCHMHTRVSRRYISLFSISDLQPGIGGELCTRLLRSGFAAVQGHESSSMWRLDTRARISKRLRSPGIDSASLLYVAWRAGTITLFVIPARWNF
jgi:hypothetical protein